jgi:hypothetical protein
MKVRKTREQSSHMQNAHTLVVWAFAVLALKVFEHPIGEIQAKPTLLFFAHSNSVADGEIVHQ